MPKKSKHVIRKHKIHMQINQSRTQKKIFVGLSFLFLRPGPFFLALPEIALMTKNTPKIVKLAYILSILPCLTYCFLGDAHSYSAVTLPLLSCDCKLNLTLLYLNNRQTYRNSLCNLPPLSLPSPSSFLTYSLFLFLFLSYVKLFGQQWLLK